MNTSEVDSIIWDMSCHPRVASLIIFPHTLIKQQQPWHSEWAVGGISYLQHVSLKQLGANLKTEPAGSCSRSQHRSQNLLQSWLPFSTSFKGWNRSRIDIFSCAAGATLDLAPRPLSSRSNYSKPWSILCPHQCLPYFSVGELNT